MKSHWPTKKLGEICEKIKAGGTPSRKISKYWGGEIPFVKIEDLTSAKLYLENTQEKITQEGLENSNAWIIPPNSVLFSIYASIGEVAINKFPVTTNQAILGLIPKSEIVVPNFLAYSLKKFGKYLISYNIQSTQKNLTLEVVKNFKIPLPPLSIQQKIVKILDTIQEAIDIHDKIIEKTKELKKSLMAELFKYGAPSFRKERKLKKTEIGEIPEDWKVVRLGEVVNEMINGFPTGERDENGILQLRMDSITSDGKINLEAGVKVPRRIGIENYFLRKGDILFNNTNSIDLVGKTALFRGEFKECVFSNHLTRIRVDLNKTLPEWIFYILLRNWELKLFKNLATRRVGQADINRNVLKNLKVPLPPLPEQQEIAEILQTIDQKIDLERRKKELYEELFKTMLNKIMNQEIDVENIEV